MSYLRMSKFIGTEIQRLIQSGRSGERNGELLFVGRKFQLHKMSKF